MNAIVALEGVGHTYRSEAEAVTPFAGVDLSVVRGEMVAVVGPSGHGKSTLLHILAGLLRPTVGQVWLAGRDTGTLSVDALDRLRSQTIGLSFQVPYLVSALTAAENLQLTARVIARGNRKRRLELEAESAALMERLGVAHRRHFLPHQLSIGQRRRVALIRALLGRPPLILADEPTNDLDPEGADLVMRTLHERAQQGTGVLFISHELQRIELADRAYRLEAGTLDPITRRGGRR